MGVVGIQSLTLGLSVCLVVATGLILGGIAVSTGNKATDDARAAGDKGINHCLATGRSNIEGLTSNLLTAVLSEVKLRMYRMVELPTREVAEVTRYIELYHPDVATNPDFVSNTIRPIIANKMKSRGMTAIGIYLDAVSPNSATLSIAHNGSWGGHIGIVSGIDHPVVLESRVGHFFGPFGLSDEFNVVGNPDSMGYMIPGPCKLGRNEEGDLALDGVCPLIGDRSKPQEMEIIEGICYKNARFSDPSLPLSPEGSVSFSPILPGVGGGIMSMCKSTVHPEQVPKYPRQGKRTGFMFAGFGTNDVAQVMKAMTLPKGSILYAVQKHPSTGLVDHVAGTNVGNSTQLQITRDKTGSIVSAMSYPIHVLNHTNDGTTNGSSSVMSRHAHHILKNDPKGSLYEVLSNLPVDSVSVWTDSGDDDKVYWTRVSKFKFYNIFWYISFITPQASIMSQLDAAELAILATISLDKESVNQSSKRNFAIMYIITGVCSCVLIGLSYVLTKKIVSPLNVLKAEMAMVALMQTDNIDVSEDSISCLSEVSEMQQSFREMVKRLVEFKSFMPQSVLYLDTSSDEGNSESTKGESNSLTDSASRSTSKQFLMQGQALEVCLKVRSVTVLTFNVVGWHKTVCQRGTDSYAVLETHRSLIELITTTVSASKGMCDCFCGDRLLAHFNTIRPNATHIDMAAVAGQTASKECRGTVGDNVRLSFAVTSGEARVGNIGIPGMKKYSILSPIVPYASVLESLNCQLGTVGLCDSVVEKRSTKVVCKAAVITIFNKMQKRVQIAFEITTTITQTDAEWMYQLETAKSHEYANWNKAAYLVKNSENSEALSLFKEYEFSERENPLYGRWIKCASGSMTAVDLLAFSETSILSDD